MKIDVEEYLKQFPHTKDIVTYQIKENGKKDSVRRFIDSNRQSQIQND